MKIRLREYSNVRLKIRVYKLQFREHERDLTSFFVSKRGTRVGSYREQSVANPERKNPVAASDVQRVSFA